MLNKPGSFWYIILGLFYIWEAEIYLNMLKHKFDIVECEQPYLQG